MNKRIARFIKNHVSDNIKLDSYESFLFMADDFELNRRDYKLSNFTAFDDEERHLLFKRAKELNKNRVYYKR